MLSSTLSSWRDRPAASIRLLAVLLIAAVVAMYGPFDRLAQADNAPQAAADYSGEDIFRATFLGNGPAAGLMPEMQAFRAEAERHKDYDPIEAQKGEADLMSALETADSAFFDDLKTAFTSGDPRVVSQAHSEAADAVLVALYQSRGLDPDTVPDDLIVGVFVVVLVVLAIVAVAVAVVVVLVVISLEKASMQYDTAYETVDLDDYDQLVDSYSGSLDRDVFIADITTAFAKS